MNKTRVDDMLIEMIQPKIKEIEDKFSRGDGLTQEDINTLLLKSQYNHINHLDDKLNEVTASVVALENKFLGLENKFESFKSEINAEFNALRGDFATFKADIEASMQKALNRNMMMMVGMIGFFVMLSKIIDKF